MTRVAIPKFALAALSLLYAEPALAQDTSPIGQTTAVVRDVQGAINAKSTPLKIGDKLVFLEEISAGEASAAQMRFIDATELSVGANSRVTLDAFVFTGSGSPPAMATQLVTGVLRFVTGQMEKDAYNVRTGVAVVGVRGTVFDLIIAPDGATIVYVEEGSIQFANLGGTAVTVTAGLASRIDAQSGPPSPPQPPAPGALAPVVAMTTTLATAALPADVIPDATTERVAALAAAAAKLADETDSSSPGGGLK